jgi:hypothetical protein
VTLGDEDNPGPVLIGYDVKPKGLYLTTVPGVSRLKESQVSHLITSKK